MKLLQVRAFETSRTHIEKKILPKSKNERITRDNLCHSSGNEDCQKRDEERERERDREREIEIEREREIDRDREREREREREEDKRSDS